jgi:hypothetical protein
MRKLKNRSSRVVGFVVLAMATGAFFVWALPGVAGLTAENDMQVSGTVGKLVGMNSESDPCTSSGSYVNMPGANVTFHTTAPHQRALVFFEGSWFNEDGSPRGDIQLRIDGNLVEPDDVETVDTSSPDQTHGFNWISQQLHNTGSHTAQIQWMRVGGAATDDLCVNERSLIVLTP